MADRHTLKLIQANRDVAHKGVDAAIAKGRGGKPWVLELREWSRSDEQNRALHGLIGQIMKQRPTLNGIRMDMARWKATFLQALGHELVMLPTLAGDGMFPLGLSTSKLTVGEFSELMELILAWTAQEGLVIKHFGEFAVREDAGR